MTSPATKERIILDCDPGYDDAAALILAAGSPRIELLAVTTVAGNQTIEKVTRNALRVMALAGLDDVPVAAGAVRPLINPPAVCPEIHGESGLDGTTLPERCDLSKLERRHAAELIADIVMREPEGTVTLVPTGPLTNVALAVRLEPRIVERVKSVVLMGGGVHIGNVGPIAEFNLENDPEAAAIVFGEKWRRLVMVGLDLTYQARATPDVREAFAKIGTPAATFLHEVLEAFGEKYRKSRGFDAPPLHDPCAVAHVIDPTVVEAVPAPVHVELRGEFTRGMTVADLRRPAPEGCAVFVAKTLDAPRFWALLRDAAARIGAR